MKTHVSSTNSDSPDKLWFGLPVQGTCIGVSMHLYTFLNRYIATERYIKQFVLYELIQRTTASSTSKILLDKTGYSAMKLTQEG